MTKRETPGLRTRKRRGGKTVYYWVAEAAAPRKAAGYPIKTVRLEDPTPTERAAHCLELTAGLLEWLGEAVPIAKYDGTIASLIDSYRTDEDSPYQNLRERTRKGYDGELRLLRKQVGARHVRALTRKDFAKWHRAFAAPKPILDREGKPLLRRPLPVGAAVLRPRQYIGRQSAAVGADAKPAFGPPRIRSAHGLMTMLRIILNFGVSMRFTGCKGAAEVLAVMTFESPAPRRTALTYEQASRIVEHALAEGRPSIALGQALQFELAMRQFDVTGYWVSDTDAASGITHMGRRWTGGLMWSDLTPNMTVAKRTTKTSTLGEWDLTLCPLVLKALAAFPREHRIGPMIVSEGTGRPYAESEYARTWRPIATAVGVPLSIWNRDSRSGGLTEAGEAGAQPEDMRQFGTHSSFNTTSRYLRRSLESTSRVSELRVAKRTREEG